MGPMWLYGNAEVPPLVTHLFDWIIESAEAPRISWGSPTSMPLVENLEFQVKHSGRAAGGRRPNSLVS